MSIFKTKIVTELRDPVTWDTCFLKREKTDFNSYGSSVTKHTYWQRITYSGRYVTLKTQKAYECRVESEDDKPLQWIDEEHLQFPQETF